MKPLTLHMVALIFPKLIVLETKFVKPRKLQYMAAIE